MLKKILNPEQEEMEIKIFDSLQIPIFLLSSEKHLIIRYNFAFQKLFPAGYDIKRYFLEDNPDFIDYIKKVKEKKEIQVLFSLRFRGAIQEEVKNNHLFRVQLQYLVSKSLIIGYFYKFDQEIKTNFSILSDYLPVGIVIHQNQKIVYANQHALQLLQAQEEKDIVGKDIKEFVESNYQEVVQKRIDNLYSKNLDAPPLEEVLLTLEKKPFYAEVRAKKIQWNQKPAVLVIFQDITKSVLKRKFSEKLLILLQKIIQEKEIFPILKELLSTFEIILQANLVCIWFEEAIPESKEDFLHRLKTKKLNVRILSSKEKEVHIQYLIPLLEMYHFPLINCLVSRKPVFHREIIREIQDPILKEIFLQNQIISYWCLPLLDYQRRCKGCLICYFDSVQDITEISIDHLYQASSLCSLIIEREEIGKENDLLSQISRRTNDGLLLFDSSFRILWYNDKMIQLVPHIQLQNYPEISSFIQQLKISNLTSKSLLKKIYNKKPFQINLILENHLQEKTYFRLLFEDLKNQEGSLLGYYLIFHDVTRETQYEQQLIEAKNIAEKNAQAKSEFLSIMSHEIRTPLNVIVGIIQILIHNQPRKDQLDDLRLLKSSSEHLLSLVNDILDYNKIEAGKLELQKEVFLFKEFLYGVVDLFCPQMEEKQLQFIINFDSSLPEQVIGDKTRLNQILFNLLSNAIKFTEKGKIQFDVHKLKEVNNQISIRFMIQDTGIGIPEEYLDKIFEPFTQLDSRPSRKAFGTGLGLAITRKLIELFNGKIWIESKKEKGTKVTFEITFGVPASSYLTIPDFQVQNTSFSRIKVLIVEDYLPNLLITKKFLELWNIPCDSATNGEEAIHKVKQNSYSLILMDLHMPEMDGYVTTKKIREFENNIPIIAVTASALEDVKEKIIHYGITDIIIKPFRPEELYKKIISYIDVKRISTMDFSI